MTRRAALVCCALPPASPSLGSGRAMGLAFGAARALWPLVLLLGAARAAQGVVEASAGPALVAALSGDPVPAAGAWICAWLLCQLAASLVLALAAHAGASWLAGAAPSAAAAPGSAYSSAVAFFVAGGAVSLTARLWMATALASRGLAYLGALGQGRLGGLSAPALALA